jgi:methylthioribose-1-phosphate isomerase
MQPNDFVSSVRFDEITQELVIIDQTKLPGETVLLTLNSVEEVYDAIYFLKVRGAPAIGVAAAFGLYLAATKLSTNDPQEFLSEVHRLKAYLASSRPTAVNLCWALDRMENSLSLKPTDNVKSMLDTMRAEALAIRLEDIAVCQTIGQNALPLLADGDGILTHCNAGRLATIAYGTALAPIYLGHERGMTFKVFADETRPLLQGARLTAYELTASGIDTTLICDNMSAQVMKNGWINKVIVGTDRVAANGDCCNKIGTNGVAILAKYYKIPFYVCAPTSTIDILTPTGDEIVIEQRPASEVTEMWYDKPMAPKEVKVYNPAFDVTPAELISAIITEKGIIYPPFKPNLMKLMKGE